MLYDNSSVLRIMMKEQIYKPTIEDMNRWIASNISESTIPYRFSGSLNTSQRKIATNVVCFPRMHFLTFSMCNQFAVNPLVSALKPDNMSLPNYYGGGGKVFNVYAGIHDHLTSE
jgi:hypothetical protein